MGSPGAGGARTGVVAIARLSSLKARDKGIFYVKVFDGTLCIKPWVGKKKGGAGKPTSAA